VFVPLVDLHEANGPTEFHLGTHVKANLVLPQRHTSARCGAGAVVLYDTRIMHRGGANRAEAERPIVYLTFSRVWYRDTLNP
jgi:ectoine hydroxylase-related dioxygenase (phytanoyl-CoA dioxygenase family)